jgi:hypothetical protein
LYEKQNRRSCEKQMGRLKHNQTRQKKAREDSTTKISW